MTDKRPAPLLQSSTRQFFATLGWATKEHDARTLHATKKVAGKELRWALFFEDEHSFSQLTSPQQFVKQILQKTESDDFVDLIITEKIFDTRRWSDEVKPLLDRDLATVRNRQYGTWTAFLNRFAAEISEAQIAAFQRILAEHFIRRPVRARFTNGADAIQDCANWLGAGGARIMLVTGGPGAGKSVFALSLASEIHALFSREQNRLPAPFLIWFSTDRPAVLEDLIGVTLQDLHVTDLTPEAVKFLLAQGRVVFILDGFDEISRALAQRAEETIDKLSVQINRNTNGRLILTSRPAFLDHEKIYFDLTTACEEEQPERRDIAPYNDGQQREWVIQNAPDQSNSQPPDRHWQRVQTAFGNNPWLRELCRTPVFLRMLSEVLVKESSVRSRDDLITKFCTGMWERERRKRKLVLSDGQYLLAYEAISAAIVDSGRIDSREVKSWLELYLGEDAKQLLAELPEDVETLIKDLAIGPLTGTGGHFAFEHEILTGYFFARLLVRKLKERNGRLRDLWNKKIYEPAWEFLPDAVGNLFDDEKQGEAFLTEISKVSQDGLMLWNLAMAIGGSLPKSLFKGKDIAGVVFENRNAGDVLDLRHMVFDNCNLHDVIFSRCDLSNTTFRNAKIGHMRFVECRPGAIFDSTPTFTSDDAEIVLIRPPKRKEQVYTTRDIQHAIAILSGADRKHSKVLLPQDLARSAAIIIFQCLYKSDGRSLDYPEPRKIENRLRAWLDGFELEAADSDQYLSVFMKMFGEFEQRAWICHNPNRPRTRAPCEARAQTISHIVRSGTLPIHVEQLQEIVSNFQGRIRALGTA